MANQKKSLIVTIGPPHEKPWWWDYITFNNECEVEYYRLTVGDKKGSQISTRDIPYITLKIMKKLFFSKDKYDFIFTFECDMTSFLISLIQAVTFQKTPKHVILTFIMREYDETIKSKIKYFIMRRIFKSLHKAICSSRKEAEYYDKVFKWKNKAKFVPLACAPDYLKDLPEVEMGDYIIAAGRTYRDYPTLIKAMTNLDVKLIIVASPGLFDEKNLPPNISIRYDIDIKTLNDLILKSRFVVLPLAKSDISIGQSVLLQAMAMKKAVITTLINGTEDYIEHMQSGIFVEPYNSIELADYIRELYSDKKLCDRLGANALQLTISKYTPQKYYEDVSRLIS